MRLEFKGRDRIPEEGSGKTKQGGNTQKDFSSDYKN